MTTDNEIKNIMELVKKDLIYLREKVDKYKDNIELLTKQNAIMSKALNYYTSSTHEEKVASYALNEVKKLEEEYELTKKN